MNTTNIFNRFVCFRYINRTLLYSLTVVVNREENSSKNRAREKFILLPLQQNLYSKNINSQKKTKKAGFVPYGRRDFE